MLELLPPFQEYSESDANQDLRRKGTERTEPLLSQVRCHAHRALLKKFRYRRKGLLTFGLCRMYNVLIRLCKSTDGVEKSFLSCEAATEKTFRAPSN